MVEEDKKLNKGIIVKKKKYIYIYIYIRKDAKDLVHKELYKIYYKTSIIIYSICRVTNCSSNPDGIGYGPDEPNTINL